MVTNFTLDRNGNTWVLGLSGVHYGTGRLSHDLRLRLSLIDAHLKGLRDSGLVNKAKVEFDIDILLDARNELMSLSVGKVVQA